MKRNFAPKSIKAAVIILAVIIAMLSFTAAGAEDDPVAPQCDDPYVDTQY